MHDDDKLDGKEDESIQMGEPIPMDKMPDGLKKLLGLIKPKEERVGFLSADEVKEFNELEKVRHEVNRLSKRYEAMNRSLWGRIEVNHDLCGRRLRVDTKTTEIIAQVEEAEG